MKNWFQFFSKSKEEYLLAVLKFTRKGEKKNSQIFSKLFFYLLILYKNIPKMSKLSKNYNGKWMQ
jgi:hypothetical protein